MSGSSVLTRMWSRSDGRRVRDCCQFHCWRVVVVGGSLMGQYHDYAKDAAERSNERLRQQSERLRMESLTNEVRELRDRIVELQTELERVQRELGNRNV